MINQIYIGHILLEFGFKLVHRFVVLATDLKYLR